MDAQVYAAFLKYAEDKAPSIAKTMLQGVGGMSLGYLGGYGAGRGIEALAKRTGVPASTMAMKVLPIAGLVGGAAYPAWKAYEQKEIARAVAHKRSQK